MNGSGRSAEEPIRLDSRIFGREGLQSPWLIPGERPALIDPGPASRAGSVAEAVAGACVGELASVVLTHIHFDHAGGAAELARLNPGSKIYVHPRVARFLIEPAPLFAAVESVWGELTGPVFGLPEPAVEQVVETVSDGDRIGLGGGRFLEVVETPGHTRAHLAFLESDRGYLFPGDATGIELPGSEVVRPSTPPSDYDRTSFEGSLELLRSLGATRMFLPHFGEARPDPDTVIGHTAEALFRWHEAFDELPANGDRAGELRRRAEPDLPVGVAEGLELVNPAWLNLAGMEGESARLARSGS